MRTVSWCFYTEILKEIQRRVNANMKINCKNSIEAVLGCVFLVFLKKSLSEGAWATSTDRKWWIRPAKCLRQRVRVTKINLLEIA